MAWCAFLSFTVAAVNVGVQLAKAPFRDRAAAPQRAVALLAITVLAVEAAFTAGALVDFEQLRHNGLGAATRHKEEEEEDDDEGESSGSNGDGDKSNDDVVPWKRKLCLAQGATFQWAVHAMVLVFLWFQYAQYRKLVQREAPEEVEFTCSSIMIYFMSLYCCLSCLAFSNGASCLRQGFIFLRYFLDDN